MKTVYEKYPPFFLTSFPKSGVHLLDQMFSPITATMAGELRIARNWISSHNNSGWGPEENPKEYVFDKLEKTTYWGFGVGHLAAYMEFMNFFEENKWPVIFLWRDLRDIAISEAHHVMNESPMWIHPAKEELSAIPDLKDRIKAIIAGHKGWPSLSDRWALYAGWLTQGWVLHLRYDEVVLNMKLACTAIIKYLSAKQDKYYNLAIVDAMMSAVDPTTSQTFRSGKASAWREVFDQDLIEFSREHLEPWITELNMGW